MSNPFLQKNAQKLLDGVSEGDKLSITWFLNSAALGGATEMGPITFKVLDLDDNWISLRDVQHGAYIRLPVTALRSVRHAE